MIFFGHRHKNYDKVITRCRIMKKKIGYFQ